MAPRDAETRQPRQPLDRALVLADPDAPDELVTAAASDRPSDHGPQGDDLVRFAWASAVLDNHPTLLAPWSGSEWAADRAVRRAMMRSPRLDEHLAEQILSVRRSGVHTLGSNPAIAAHLLERNPSAARTWHRMALVIPAGLDDVRADPNRPELVDLLSPTVDLVIARSVSTTATTARRIVDRSARPADPWTVAVFAARFPGAGLLGRTPAGRGRRVRIATALLPAVRR